MNPRSPIPPEKGIWGIVKIMVPFLGPYYNTGPNMGPNLGDPKKGP